MREILAASVILLITALGCKKITYSGRTDVVGLFLSAKHESFDKYFDAFSEIFQRNNMIKGKYERGDFLNGNLLKRVSHGLTVTVDSPNQYIKIFLPTGSGDTVREFKAFYPEGTTPILAVAATDARSVNNPYVADLKFFRAQDGEWSEITNLIFPKIVVSDFGIPKTADSAKLLNYMFVHCQLPIPGTDITCKFDLEPGAMEEFLPPYEPESTDPTAEASRRVSAVYDGVTRHTILRKWNKATGQFTQDQ